MKDIRIGAEEKKHKEFEEKELGEKAEVAWSKKILKESGNQEVKLAMAEELIRMGISKTSAHRILNIMGHKGK